MKILSSIIGTIHSPRHSIYKKAHRFIKSYEGFSYDFERNGEKKLVNNLSSFEFHTIFDVGANVGDWTTIALDNFPNAKIHSFELSKDTFTALRNNHETNDRVSVNNIGLSNEVGQIQYKDYGVNSGVNTIIKGANFHDDRKAPVEKIANLSTGDAYCEETDIDEIDFVKIDVEGAENLVVQGFENKLNNNKIKVIQFEYGYTNADANFLIKDFYNYLTPKGYLLGPLKPSGVLFMDFDYALNNFNSGPNFVAVHKSQQHIINAVKGAPILGFPRR